MSKTQTAQTAGPFGKKVEGNGGNGAAKAAETQAVGQSSEASAAPKKTRKPRGPSTRPPVVLNPQDVLIAALQVSKVGGSLHDVCRIVADKVPEEMKKFITPALIKGRLAYLRSNEQLKAAGVIVPSFGSSRARFDWAALAKTVKSVTG